MGDKWVVKYKDNLWKKDTIIKDAVHGYISIPKPIVREIIDTETFQRLKNIEQTGMEALYPSATHNRFTHSLGVYHLSKMSFEQFRKNVKADFNSIYEEVKNKYAKKADDVWDRWGMLFQLASLLHDCGHSPFSHTLEFIYDLPVENSLNDRLNERMSVSFREDMGYNNPGRSGNPGRICGAPHERMSALFIRSEGTEFFYNRIERLMKDYVLTFLAESNLYEKDNSAFDDDIEFMIRMIIGCKYRLSNADNYLAKKFYSDESGKCWYTELQLRNCIIGMLNSKLDVDNLDYVIRDSKYSGYANQSIDVERLLSSLTIVTGFELKEAPLAKEDTLNCCVNLVEFKGSYINARISGACHIGSHLQDINAHGNVYFEGDETRRSQATQRSFRTAENFSAQIVFPIGGAEEGNTEVAISALNRGQEKERETCYLNIRGNLEGKFSGIILKNEGNIPSKWEKFGYRRIFPAYYQNCMSVLMSAVEGSNFEKKWVYSHQISTFTNNFLNIYLLEKYAQILMLKELDIYNGELKKLIAALNNNLEEGQLKSVTEEEKKSGEELGNEIRGTFWKGQDAVVEFLENTANGKNIRDIRELLDCFITYKKIHGKSNEDIVNLINRIAEQKRELGSDSYSQLRDFNKKYMRLRGRETQYFWDIIAMCEPKSIMGYHFSRSCDKDLIALYKQEYLCTPESNRDSSFNNVHQEFAENFEYLIKRNFMKCMWKSYPEYLFYFQDWTEEEKKALEIFLKPHTVPKGFEYLVLSDTIGENRAAEPQKKFWEYLKAEYGLKRFASVSQVIKTKHFIPYETYLKRDGQVVRLEDIGLFTSAKKDEKFYFFYYEQFPGKRKIDVIEILDWIRKEINESQKKKERLGKYNKTDMTKEIIIRDNIYGNICIPYKIRLLIDCKEFQRLRRITQLATAGQIFPGAAQNRFSHSLGVYYLMEKIVAHFEKKLSNIGYQDSIKDLDRDAVLVAALLHDIGHGPFSHAFEKAGINREDFNHEYWTKEIIRSPKTDINQTLRGLWGEEFPELVVSYIDCRTEVKDKGIQSNRYFQDGLNLKFIFASLVSSQLDADRMDYLLRDSKACGVAYGQFDLERLIQGMSIAINSDGGLKVGIEEQYVSDVEEYFYARYLMYNNVYYHPFKVLTEKLLQSILREACNSYISGFLKPNELPPILIEVFNHATLSLRDFCDLDDHVVMGAIQTWANLKGEHVKRLSMLCGYFINRFGYRQLNILNPKMFSKKLSNESKNPCNILDEKSDRYDFVYCKKEVQMYNIEKGDIYIIRKNGIITKLQDIGKMKNLKNEEGVLYHSAELTKIFYPEDEELVGQLIQEFDINNSVEIEKKYILKKDADVERVTEKILDVIRKKGYEVDNGIVRQQNDVYYDTDNGTLRKNDFSIRIRTCENKRYITCKYKTKSESNGESSQLERFESERNIQSDDLKENERFIDESVIELLRNEKYNVSDLRERVKVANKRKKYVIQKKNHDLTKEDEQYELVFDNVTYQNTLNSREANEIQVEIELKSGYETRINMKELTDALETAEEIVSITDSKYCRALKLTEESN